MNPAYYIQLAVKPQSIKYLYVTYEYDASEHDVIDFVMPVWTPGSYMVREFAAQVSEFTVTDSRSAKKLKAEKTAKNIWRIHSKESKKIRWSYRVFAGDLSVRACYSDKQFLFINMPSVFGFVAQKLQSKVFFKLSLPSNYKVAIQAPQVNKTFHFKNVDEFYDSPLLASPQLEILTGKVKNTRIKMAFYGNHTADLTTILKSVQKIVAQQMKLFNTHPCRDYLFQVLFVAEMYGGLEHHSSSTNLFDGSKLNQKKERQKFLELLSHEHFHLYNVKRIRPVALGPFDYCRENYTHDLWLAEGFTSYFDAHFLWRAKELSFSEYLAELTFNLNKVYGQKAYQVDSLAQASFDSWIRYYRPSENSINTNASYYIQGGLLALYLDLLIIKNSNGKKNLDTVMRYFWLHYKSNPESGLTRADILAGLKTCLAPSLVAFIEKKYINGSERLPFKDLFKFFGIKFDVTIKTQKNFGILFHDDHQKLTIKSVAEDSAAFICGLQAGDEVLAINNKRVTSINEIENFNSFPLQLLASRHKQILKFNVEAPFSTFEVDLTPVGKSSQLQFWQRSKL